MAGAASDRTPGQGRDATEQVVPIRLPVRRQWPGAAPPDPRRRAAALRRKHALDRLAAVVGLITLAPVFLALVVLVRVAGRGGGRALVGVTHWACDGRSFARLALRPTGHEGVDRLLARHGLRQLPELVNVARGEMSLVGPRPRRLDVAARPGLPATRLRSGITGFAQVHQPTDAALERRLDAVYLERWSPALDRHILWRTVAGGRCP